MILGLCLRLRAALLLLIFVIAVISMMPVLRYLAAVMVSGDSAGVCYLYVSHAAGNSYAYVGGPSCSLLLIPEEQWRHDVISGGKGNLKAANIKQDTKDLIKYWAMRIDLCTHWKTLKAHGALLMVIKKQNFVITVISMIPVLRNLAAIIVMGIMQVFAISM